MGELLKDKHHLDGWLVARAAGMPDDLFDTGMVADLYFKHNGGA